MRRRRSSVSVYVDVDIDEILSEIDTDVLKEVLTLRNEHFDEVREGKLADLVVGPLIRAMEVAIKMLEQGRRYDALEELTLALLPHDPAKAWAAAADGNHPFLTRGGRA